MEINKRRPVDKTDVVSALITSHINVHTSTGLESHCFGHQNKVINTNYLLSLSDKLQQASKKMVFL